MDSSSSDTPQSAEENIAETPTTHPESPSEIGEPENEFDRADDQLARSFTEGQLLRFIRVRFPGNNKSFTFYIGDREYPFGQKVLAMSDRGLAVGFINSQVYEMKFNKSLLPIRSIIRVATADDALVEQENFRSERKLREIADRLIEKNGLDMTLTQVEVVGLGKKAIFYFTAPTRVDFRGLVHEMVSEMKMRIELRQISVRDRAASVGGLGPCGRELCCSSFLARYGNVGIKLAKNQDLSLNSSKINGVCGQLKCCLTYEDEVYQEKRKKLPRENAIVKTKDGHAGKVVRLHILSEQFETISPEGVIRRYVAEMWDGAAEGVEIPKYFENGVTDNTKTVVGLDLVNAEKAKQHEKDIAEIKTNAKSYADKLFEELFGAKTLDFSLPEVPEIGGARKIITPDEEEEIIYVAPEDEILDEDDDEEDLEEEDENGEVEDGREASFASPAPTVNRTEPERRPPQEPRRQQDSQRHHDHRRDRGPRRDQPRDHGRPQGEPRRDQPPRREGQQGQGPRPPRPDENRGPAEGQPRREYNQPSRQNRHRPRRGGGGGQGGGGQRPQN